MRFPFCKFNEESVFLFICNANAPKNMFFALFAMQIDSKSHFQSVLLCKLCEISLFSLFALQTH